jgi:4-amino-4-deoxy-L-arabinose transferase-like glycosyltransferase
MQLHTIKKTMTANWKRMALYGVLAAIFAGLIAVKLGSLTGGYSAHELQTTLDASGWKHIADNPLNAPFLVAIRLAAYVFDNQLLAARIVAGACGMVTLVLFYALVRHWHGERAAVAGTLLFGMSPWFLHTARLGTPEVLQFGLLALVVCYVLLKHTGSGIALLAGFVVTAALLYVPGMVWFIALGILMQWRSVDKYFKRNLWAVTAGGVVLLAALVPLGLAVYHHPAIAKVYAGLPATGWPDVLHVVKNIAEVPVHVFVQGQANPEHWLGKLALLDYFAAAMFFLGGYLYVQHVKLPRFWVVAVALAAGTILIGLGGGVTLTTLLPFIYIVVAAGTGLLLQRWLAVFPRNVIAQSVGYGLVGLAVAITCVYSAKHYFVAWPQAKPTKAVFTLKDQS